jgi:hypothetical protein
VWALCIVVLAPVLDDDTRLGEAVEQLPVQQLVAELGVEALAAWLDERGPGTYVDRCCPSTRRASRSDTSNFVMT